MGEKSVNGASHLLNRSGTYYFQRRVPDHISSALKNPPPNRLGDISPELLDYFAGKSMVRFSLKTKDKKMAVGLCIQEDLRFNNLQTRIEQWLAKGVSTYDTVSHETLKGIAHLWLTRELKEDEERRLGTHEADFFDLEEVGMDQMVDDLRQALMSTNLQDRLDFVTRVADGLLREFQLMVDKQSTSYAYLHRELVKNFLHLFGVIRSRNRGEDEPIPQLSPVIAPEAFNGGSVGGSGKVLHLGGVIDTYIGSIKQTHYTRKVKRCLQLFGEVVGRDLPVTEIRQKTVTNFLRDICRLPSDWASRFDQGVSVASMLATEHEETIAPSTYKLNYRSPLKAFLVDSLRDHGDEGFPALTVDRIEYVGTRAANVDQQRALTPDELKVLIQGERFKAIAHDKDQEGLYWLTLLLLFTGARPREICQVNPQVDFGEMDGEWYIDLSPFTAAGKGIVKTIKTGEERRIPVHHELVKLGFPQYVQRIKGQGADRLFPGFRVKSGNPFEVAGDDFTKMLKDVGLYNDQAAPGQAVLGAYVMRKTFITQCRNQGVVSREITGHSDGSTTSIQDRHYVFGPEPLSRKVAELKKFKLDLEIPRR